MAKLDTAEDWWAEVELRNTQRARSGAVQLKELIFGDVGCPVDALCSTIMTREELYGRGTKMARTALAGREKMTLESAIDDMIEKQDSKLWYIFQSIWQDAPDRPHIHQWTMWGAFCDLCSEGPSCLWPEGDPPNDEG